MVVVAVGVVVGVAVAVVVGVAVAVVVGVAVVVAVVVVVAVAVGVAVGGRPAMTPAQLLGRWLLWFVGILGWALWALVMWEFFQ